LGEAGFVISVLEIPKALFKASFKGVTGLAYVLLIASEAG